MFDEQKDKEHESFGMLNFSRVTCSHPQALFGSSLKHSNYIKMELKTATVSRGLNEDWYFGRDTILEVDMSATQFSDLITSLNQGSGVPVTIRYCRQGKLKKMEETPFVDRNEIHKQEFENYLGNSLKDCKALISKLEELFNTKKTLNKQDKKDILDSVRRVARNISSNLDFQLDQFDRHMERSKTEAKGEIEAFFQNKLTSLASEAIKENPDLLKETHSPVQIEDTKED